MADNFYKSIDITIPANGEYKLFRQTGFLKVLASDQSLFEISIGRDSKGIAFNGFGINIPQTADNIILYNPNGSELNITLGVSKAQIFDDRVSLTGSITANIEAADSSDLSNPSVDVTNSTNVSVIAANATRKAFEIFNNSATTLYYTAGDSSASKGAPILAGGSYYSNFYNGEVFVRADTATIAKEDITIIEYEVA